MASDVEDRDVEKIFEKTIEKNLKKRSKMSLEKIFGKMRSF